MQGLGRHHPGRGFAPSEALAGTVGLWTTAGPRGSSDISRAENAIACCRGLLSHQRARVWEVHLWAGGWGLSLCVPPYPQPHALQS